MLSQGFYRVLISDKEISRDRQKEDIHWFEETKSYIWYFTLEVDYLEVLFMLKSILK